MNDDLTKVEISLIGKLLAAISIDSFRDLLTKHILIAFVTAHENTNVEFNFGGSKPDPEAISFLKEREIILCDKTASKLEGDLKYQLLEGLKANEGIDTITKRLGTIFTDMMPNQLERIARTEILTAMSAGRQSAYEKSGVVEYKMIIGATDKRLCALCRRMRGQIQELKKPFHDKETGESWMYPPFHPNGRCSLSPLTRLPDNVITISGQMYAADKKLGKIEIPTIEISRMLLKSQQEKKAWVVRWANGRAVTCFEDEADADYYIETSKKKDAGWFDFGGKVYREVKSGWSIKKKGTKITFKTDGESRKVNKVEFDAGSLNKREITVPGYTTKKGVRVSAHKRMIKTTKKSGDYKSVHDYIQGATGLDVDMRKGEKFITDSLMGKQIIIRDKNKNRLDVWIKETPDMIQLSTIGAETSGTGIGTKYLNGLKGYSDLTGKKLVIPDMTPQGQKYFRTKDWLVDDTVKLEYEEDGEQREYWAPNTMSYTPIK